MDLIVIYKLNSKSAVIVNVVSGVPHMEIGVGERVDLTSRPIRGRNRFDQRAKRLRLGRRARGSRDDRHELGLRQSGRACRDQNDKDENAAHDAQRRLGCNHGILLMTAATRAEPPAATGEGTTLTLHFCDEIFAGDARNRASRVRFPGADVRTPHVSRDPCRGSSPPPSPPTEVEDWLCSRSRRMEVCDALPQRNCGRFSRPSLVPESTKER